MRFLLFFSSGLGLEGSIKRLSERVAFPLREAKREALLSSLLGVEKRLAQKGIHVEQRNSVIP